MITMETSQPSSGAPLDANSLFNVNGLVAVVTGGGTGPSPDSPLFTPFCIILSVREYICYAQLTVP